MRIENAKPGVEVVVKPNGRKFIIHHYNETKGYVYEDEDESGFSGWLLESLRLANKSKRSTLVAQIKELEGQLSLALDPTGIPLEAAERIEELEKEVAMLSVVAPIENIKASLAKSGIDTSSMLNHTYNMALEALEKSYQARIAELEKQNRAFQDQYNQSGKIIDSLIRGTYFDGRPQIERMQMIANLTGLTVTGDKNDWVTLHKNKPDTEYSGLQWWSDECLVVPALIWTDLEPWTARIVGPTSVRGDEPK